MYRTLYYPLSNQSQFQTQDYKVGIMYYLVKYRKVSEEYIPSHVDLSMSTVDVDDTDTLSIRIRTNFVFLETILCQHLLIHLSIFDSWVHMRTLCPPTGHGTPRSQRDHFYNCIRSRYHTP